MSKTSADVSEVVFDQPEERAGAMELDGSVLNRHKEEEWLEDTEPWFKHILFRHQQGKPYTKALKNCIYTIVCVCRYITIERNTK